MTLRHKALLEETEMLRGFAAAAPWPIWARRAGGGMLLPIPPMRAPPRPAASLRRSQRDLELLDTDDRNEMARALNDN